MLSPAKAMTLVIALLILSPSAIAQDSVSQETLSYAKIVGKNCKQNWESQPCLHSLSKSALALASNYATNLQNQGKASFTEDIKQHCAAATAAIEGTYPAKAMNSAYTECANTLYDISEKTDIAPDPSHYQLLVAGILCLNKNEQCPYIEKSLP